VRSRSNRVAVCHLRHSTKIVVTGIIDTTKKSRRVVVTLRVLKYDTVLDVFKRDAMTYRHNLSNWPTKCTNSCFIISLLYSSTCFEHCCAHHQEVKNVLYSIWCHYTETSEWSKITKIQFYKYEYMEVKFMYEFFMCDYCILLTIHMLCHVGVTFIQLLNLLKRYYVYLHLCCWIYLVIKSYRFLISCCAYKVTYIRLLNLLKYTVSIHITSLKRVRLETQPF